LVRPLIKRLAVADRKLSDKLLGDPDAKLGHRLANCRRL